MPEYNRAKYVVELLNKKIHENESILDEKSKAIIESLDSFYNSKGEIMEINYQLLMTLNILNTYHQLLIGNYLDI